MGNHWKIVFKTHLDGVQNIVTELSSKELCFGPTWLLSCPLKGCVLDQRLSDNCFELVCTMSW